MACLVRSSQHGATLRRHPCVRHRGMGLLLAAMLVTSPALAADVTLSGAEIRALITGRTVALQTTVGQIPLRYEASGAVSGDLGGVSAVARLFAPRETGKWWIRGDAMCQQWPSWYDGKRFCFRIEKQAGDRIRWLRDDGEVGLAVIR